MVKTPERGDLIEVKWLDIIHDATGNPNEAELQQRVTYALYWGTKTSKGVEALVVTNTADEDIPDQQGYTVFPTASVVGVKVVKRKPKPRRKGAKDVEGK